MSEIPEEVRQELINEGMPHDADSITQMRWLRKVGVKRKKDKEEVFAKAHRQLDKGEDEVFATVKEMIAKMDSKRLVEELTPAVILDHLLVQQMMIRFLQQRVALMGGRVDRMEEYERKWTDYLKRSLV